jgi:hypothetical protein
MKKNIITKLSIIPVMTVFVFLAGCSGGPDVSMNVPDSVCSSIVDTKCVKCHYKTRICDALGTKSERKWKVTIEHMVGHGAQLTADEQVKVVACLSSLPAGSEVVCD